MTPARFRFILIAFIGVAAAISVNALYLQEPPRHAGTLIRADRAEKRNEAQPDQAATAALPDPLAKVNTQPQNDAKQGAASAGRHPQQQRPPRRIEVSERVVRAIQRELNRHGYDAGPTSGAVDIRTRSAIIAYEFDEGLPLTGEPSEPILKALLFGTGTPDNPRPELRFEQHQALVAQVQKMLAELGYGGGPPDGQLNAATREAIAKFAADRSLEPHGRLTARLLLEMVIVTGNPFHETG